MAKSSLMKLLFAYLSAGAMKASKSTNILRPSHVQTALENRTDLYYFGLGSNMLRSKVENRGMNGSKIEILSMEPCYVENYRLAFNLRGFPPLEPAMGSLEPIVGSCSVPLLSFKKAECHGALIRLNASNYESLMRSEGVHPNATRPGYEEIVVTAIPYDRSKPPVQAIALRALPHARLARDCSPSLRYMTLLREGATELGLKADYQTFLMEHPTQQIRHFLKWMSLYSIYFMSSISRLLRGWRGLSRVHNSLLFRVYVPSTAPNIKRAMSDLVTAAILLPGCCCGYLLSASIRIFTRQEAPMVKRLRAMLVVSNRPAE